MNLPVGTHTCHQIGKFIGYLFIIRLNGTFTIYLLLKFDFDCLDPISPLSSHNFKFFQRGFTEYLALEEGISRIERGLF